MHTHDVAQANFLKGLPDASLPDLNEAIRLSPRWCARLACEPTSTMTSTTGPAPSKTPAS